MASYKVIDGKRVLNNRTNIPGRDNLKDLPDSEDEVDLSNEEGGDENEGGGDELWSDETESSDKGE